MTALFLVLVWASGFMFGLHWQHRKTCDFCKSDPFLNFLVWVWLAVSVEFGWLAWRLA